MCLRVRGERGKEKKRLRRREGGRSDIRGPSHAGDGPPADPCREVRPSPPGDLDGRWALCVPGPPTAGGGESRRGGSF